MKRIIIKSYESRVWRHENNFKYRYFLGVKTGSFIKRENKSKDERKKEKDADKIESGFSFISF